MSGMSFDLLLLIVIATLAGVGAPFCRAVFFSDGPEASALTEQSAGRILRSETDIVRAAIEVQAHGLRQELGRTLTGFQEVTLKAFGALRGGIDVQIRTFGEFIGICPSASCASRAGPEHRGRWRKEEGRLE